MNISFDWYKVFYYVCEFKSVTKAANFLCVSQPAITRHIKDLEKGLGKKLIIKQSKGIELTVDGKILYNEIKEPIEKLNEMSSNFKIKTSQYNQLIKIGAGVAVTKKYLLGTISKFHKKYPNIKFEIMPGTYDMGMQSLREGKIDIIVLSMNEIKEIYDNIVIDKWKTVNDGLVISSNVKDDYPNYIKIEDLNDYPVICKMGSGTGRLSLEHCFKEKGINFIPTYELSNNWLVEEYVRMGLGIGIICTSFLKEEIKNGELIVINTNSKIRKRDIGIAYRKDSVNIKIIKEIISEIKNV